MITATCQDCGDEHPLGDRPETDTTTACPACRSQSYTTHATTTITKSERERIEDAVSDVDNVGDETLENLCTEFDFYAELSGADVDELTDVELVGDATAQQIVEAT